MTDSERKRFVPKFIGRNISEASPTQFVFVDTETTPHAISGTADSEMLTFRLGHAISCRLERGRKRNRKEWPFTSTGEFWRFLEGQMSVHRPVWLFAHNAGFDMRVLGLPAQIRAGNYTLISKRVLPSKSPGVAPRISTRRGLCVIENSPFILELWNRAGHKLLIVDLINFMRAKLADIGAWCGIEKLVMPPFDAQDTVWAQYCQRDCEILEQATIRLIGWTKQHGMGMFRWTAPAQAMACFRHRFMKRFIEPHGDEHVTKLERASYYGGQVSCWYIGAVAPASSGAQRAFDIPELYTEQRPIGPVYQLDVCSLYPSVMRDALYPYRLIGYKDFERWEPSGSVRLGIDCIARVRIDSSTQQFPKHHHGMTCYPVGTYETVLAGGELARAVMSGSVVAVWEFARYDCYDMFTTFVDYFWQQRYMALLSRNDIEAQLCKLVLNSLHGKFAQRSPDWIDANGVVPPIDFGMWVSIDGPTRNITHYRNIGGRVQVRVEREEQPRTFPAIAAFVASAAREKMRAYRELCGMGNYYYQGVDSLYTNSAGLSNLDYAGMISVDTLGKFRIVRTEADAQFHDQNYYRIGQREVISSISARAVKVSEGKWRQEHWEGNAEGFYNADQCGVIITKRTIERQPKYTRTPIGPHGWTEPLCLHNWV